jgi:hypothetical protein
MLWMDAMVRGAAVHAPLASEVLLTRGCWCRAVVVVSDTLKARVVTAVALTSPTAAASGAKGTSGTCGASHRQTWASVGSRDIERGGSARGGRTSMNCSREGSKRMKAKSCTGSACGQEGVGHEDLHERTKVRRVAGCSSMQERAAGRARPSSTPTQMEPTQIASDGDVTSASPRVASTTTHQHRTIVQGVHGQLLSVEEDGFSHDWACRQ